MTLFFFFKQKTAYEMRISDWSSDVCSSDLVKLDGYQYCSQAVALAERGELRRSVQAASKALHVALQSGNNDLLGKAYRDLALTFSYAGTPDRADAFARPAPTPPPPDQPPPTGPAPTPTPAVRGPHQRHPHATPH